MIARGQNFEQVPINIVGSSVFGRYPKISLEKTYNLFQSDNFMVPYAGYENVINYTLFGNAVEGRGIHTSTKLNLLIVVFDNRVYTVNIFYDQNTQMTFDAQINQIGTLQSSSGIVYITENNKPQIALVDGLNIYIYDPFNTTNTFYIATGDGLFPSAKPIDFTPTYIDFHDTYFLVAAKNDGYYKPAANNTWRLSKTTDTGIIYFPDLPDTVGLIQTKPDNTQAVVRFPSRGNMIYVMGSIVTEPWFDLGLLQFPYQRQNQYNIDYGCLNPATIAAMDEIVVWLAQNEKSGPVIMFSTGGMPEKITTDGIDYLFSQLNDPADSQAFMYRQDGHLFYHINFYTDNLSLFYDFNTQKFYHACDENMNYFIASEVAFFNNQYYFVSKKNGNLYAFDTIYTTYDGLEIPRFRICRPVRKPTQEYFIANDFGFTIEQGDTEYQIQDIGPFRLITQDGQYIETQDGHLLIGNNDALLYTTPRVDLSISIDGGESFGNEIGYVMNPLGLRKNKMQWWNLGICNDLTIQLKFWGLGRFVCTEGILNTRQ